MVAADIMTFNPYVVTPEDPVALAAELMRDRDVGFVPVVMDRRSRRLTGVITDRDLAVRHVAEAHPPECRVAEHMSVEALVTVRPDATVARIATLMERAQVRRVVVTRGGIVLGVIALADLATRSGRLPRVGQVVAKISESLAPFRPPGRSADALVEEP
jgi:CBS domain-containing protein